MQDVIFDSLDCSPSFQGLLAHVSPEAALLDAAKGDVGTEHRPRIDSHLARLERFRDAVGAAHVVGEDGSTQAMVGVVGLGNSFLLCGEFGNTL